MALTAASVAAAVTNELHNVTYRGSASATGDGTTTAIGISPLGYYIVEDATFAVSIDGSPTTAFTMDYSSGILTFTSAPANETALTFQFNYVSWTAAQITAAVVAAQNLMFPYLYSITSKSITLDGADTEWELDAGVEAVTRVMTSVTGTDNYVLVPRRKYEVLDFDGAQKLRFFSAPRAATARVFQVTRMTIATMPDRALAPMVSYGCYYAIMNKLPQRVRSDIAIATQGSGVLSPRQMNDAANAFHLRFQLQREQLRMKPWSVR